MEIFQTTEGDPKQESTQKKTPPLILLDQTTEPEPGPPHEALFLALAYLPVFELLAMSEVCVSLRDSVKRDDVLPWLNVVVQRPLDSRLSDQTLMRIASMARGRLTTLALVNCSQVTDHGLQCVVEQNPVIEKLFIPGCTGLTPEGVIRAVKTLSQHGHTLKNLWINGINEIEKHHLETLHSCLQNNMTKQQKPWPFLLFHEYRNFSTIRHYKYQPMIDMEICPRCKELRAIFDCASKACKAKMEKSSMLGCRGCIFCIPRCIECGRCFESVEQEEAVCEDCLCLDCWLQLPKCNFCNKPYCRQHAEEKGCCSLESAGFVCEACKQSQYNSDDE
ncbi:F-box protein SKIP28 [Humulus lupulus]|uniref:F-box protein SKIP28 n=1 Tax=Humulus lupulus TaxID=3486 RepID=UPI002B416F8A|nr:F-box protein SKIP28 [Humulus lupulus]